MRYALRLLARSPGFTLLTVLVLTGGLGLSTFTFSFSFLHTAMVRPLPLSDGDRIVRLTRLEDGRRRPVDAADLATLRASLRTVTRARRLPDARRDDREGRRDEGRHGHGRRSRPVQRGADARQLGRPLLAADAAPGAEPVMVLTHRTWDLVFASSPAALDRVVPTIVGVVSDVPYGNPFGRDRSAEAIYVPLLQAGVTDTDVFVRYRTSEVAGRQALHQVFGAIDPPMVPGFVFRASEVIAKCGLLTVGLARLFGAASPLRCSSRWPGPSA